MSLPGKQEANLEQTITFHNRIIYKQTSLFINKLSVTGGYEVENKYMRGFCSPSNSKSLSCSFIKAVHASGGLSFK